MKKKIIAISIIAVIIAVSFAALAPHFSNPETYSKTIESLDGKRNDVIAMSASSAAISTAITLLPGDTATPIAETLADLSSTLMIVLCAVFLEKYILTLAGIVTFRFLIPLAGVLCIAYILKGNERLKGYALKTAVLGLALVILIPVSSRATMFIEETYSVSIKENIAAAQEATEMIENNRNMDENAISRLFDGVKGVGEKVEGVLGNFIESAAVLIITSCVIPILTLWIMIWVINMILGSSIRIPSKGLKKISGAGSSVRRKLMVDRD